MQATEFKLPLKTYLMLPEAELPVPLRGGYLWGLERLGHGKLEWIVWLLPEVVPPGEVCVGDPRRAKKRRAQAWLDVVVRCRGLSVWSFSSCWRGKTHVHAHSWSLLTHTSLPPPALTEKPRPARARPSPAARVATAAWQVRAPSPKEPWHAEPGRPRLAALAGQWFGLRAAVRRLGTHSSERQRRSGGQCGRGGVTAQSGASCRLFISPPPAPPLLPYFISWGWEARGFSSAGRELSSCFWYSRLRARSTRVGNLEFGHCCGQRWLFLFSFLSLYLFAPLRLHPHCQRTKAPRVAAFQCQDGGCRSLPPLSGWRGLPARALRARWRPLHLTYWVLGDFLGVCDLCSRVGNTSLALACWEA